jgi:hypothetical protein
LDLLISIAFLAAGIQRALSSVLMMQVQGNDEAL